jgi:hypothetical protein
MADTGTRIFTSESDDGRKKVEQGRAFTNF